MIFSRVECNARALRRFVISTKRAMDKFRKKEKARKELFIHLEKIKKTKPALKLELKELESKLRAVLNLERSIYREEYRGISKEEIKKRIDNLNRIILKLAKSKKLKSKKAVKPRKPTKKEISLMQNKLKKLGEKYCQLKKQGKFNKQDLDKLKSRLTVATNKLKKLRIKK